MTEHPDKPDSTVERRPDEEGRRAFTLMTAPKEDIRLLLKGFQEIIEDAEMARDGLKPGSL